MSNDLHNFSHREIQSITLGHLQAYAAFTKAAGELEMLDARDAFLSSLCEFTTITIEPNSDAVPSHPSNTSGKHPS